MREMGDALKRRCLHLYIPLPDEKLEREIVASRAGYRGAFDEAIGQIRPKSAREGLKKLPSMSRRLIGRVSYC